MSRRWARPVISRERRAVSDFVFDTPAFHGLVLPNAPVLTLARRCAWLEGPVWFADAGQLLVSDLPNNRILRWTEDAATGRGRLGVFRQPSGFANGHTRDLQGRLVGCSHARRAVSRTELDGSETVLADRYDGRRLNGPNDVMVAADGAIWFTDPHYGGSTDYEGGKHTPELPPAVYRLDPATGAVSVAADDLKGPNGLAFSPDGTLLYVSDSGAQFGDDPSRHIHVFDVDGPRLRHGRVFHTVQPGFADGLRLDEDGRVWSSSGEGVHCIAPDGALLGRILTGGTVSNLVFGGRNRSRLFICASHELKAVYTNVRGAQRP